MSDFRLQSCYAIPSKLMLCQTDGLSPSRSVGKPVMADYRLVFLYSCLPAFMKTATKKEFFPSSYGLTQTISPFPFSSRMMSEKLL